MVLVSNIQYRSAPVLYFQYEIVLLLKFTHHIAVISYDQPEIVLARELSHPSPELRWDHDVLRDCHEVTWNLYCVYQLTTEDINS